MKSTEIKHNVQNLIDKFSKEEFIYDLLLAYGISKTSVTRLKKGDYNLSKVDGEILYKKKIFFKVETSDKLLSSIEDFAKVERILKHQPRFAILTDYKHIVAKDLKLGKNLDIEIKKLPNYFDFFLPLAGSEFYNASNDNEADRNASYKMASLYDLLIDENPNIYNSKESIHQLNIFLSRLLFCFFAEDTEIFEQDSIFTNTLAQHTAENGSDTHTFLDDLFDRLDSESGKDYPDFLAKFPYVNGGLFASTELSTGGQKISSPRFTAKARKTLIDLGELQWKDINPDIFGSMIQAVVIPDYRSDLGMHYTSVENIKKLIKPLFLDELHEAFEKATTVKQLNTLIQRISKIKFFDPACGSGNFLIITYKEIRLLEIKILQKITDLEGDAPSIKFTETQLSQFYGIEIDDFAHEMAILSLWLAEHQMNRVFEEMLFDFGKSKPILPLKEAGQIKHGNATRADWNAVCPISNKDASTERSRSEVYVIGNPPYLGSRNQDTEQKEDLKLLFKKDYKSLDYVSAWFYKGGNYIKENNAKCAFVSTNSICQGEQVALTWSRILSENIEIDFAHQSFKWTNNAKGNAGVTVIIVGLRNISKSTKYLFNGNLQTEAKNINPYLVDAPNIVVIGRNTPISKFPIMTYGNMPLEGGFLRFKDDEKKNIDKYTGIDKYIKKVIGGEEFLKDINRFCFWIEDEDLADALKFDEIKNRIDKVEEFRLNGGDVARTLVSKSHQFRYRHSPNKEQIVVPCTSSENRDYIPCGIYDSSYISLNSIQTVNDAEPYVFGILSSRMHMVWVRNVGGKLKTDYRYSAKLCCNTFPFPDISDKQKENLSLYVFAIIEERAKHNKTMAQKHHPDTMPKGLLKAHQELDTAIEQCYRLQPFKNDTERLEYLFKQYERMVNDELLMVNEKGTLFAKQKKKRLNH